MKKAIHDLLVCVSLLLECVLMRVNIFFTRSSNKKKLKRLLDRMDEMDKTLDSI